MTIIQYRTLGKLVEFDGTTGYSDAWTPVVTYDDHAQALARARAEVWKEALQEYERVYMGHYQGKTTFPLLCAQRIKDLEQQAPERANHD